jgi:hypothetical protein
LGNIQELAKNKEEQWKLASRTKQGIRCYGVGEIGIIIVAILITIILHELRHGIAMQVFGAQPRYADVIR